MCPERILIVDDDREIREFIAEVASDIGLDVELADGVNAANAYRAFNPTTIILDLMMPGVDGVEFLRFLSTVRCRANIVLISGMEEKVLHSARQLGVELGLKMPRVLRKPILVEDLESMLAGVDGGYRPVTPQQIAEAIHSKQLAIRYQPKVRLCDGDGWAVESLEALVKWDCPGRGHVPPREFIPVAQRSGLIDELSDYVLVAVLDQIAQWRRRGAAPTVAINLAPQVLADLDLPDRISGHLREHGVEGRSLILEISEAAAMADPRRLMDTLTRLRLKGVGLSLDDFGTGYSSLVQLYRMPFTELKIDGSLIVDMENDRNAQTIVSSTIKLAHDLGLQVCAENVETGEVVGLLRGFGCDTAQGYYFNKPLAPREAWAAFNAQSCMPSYRDEFPSGMREVSLPDAATRC